jgi:hypothetical protein
MGWFTQIQAMEGVHDNMFLANIFQLLQSDCLNVYHRNALLRANSSHGVLSPIHVSKSRHGGKATTFEPQETVKIWLLMNKV